MTGPLTLSVMVRSLPVWTLSLSLRPRAQQATWPKMSTLGSLPPIRLSNVDEDLNTWTTPWDLASEVNQDLSSLVPASDVDLDLDLFVPFSNADEEHNSWLNSGTQSARRIQQPKETLSDQVHCILTGA